MSTTIDQRVVEMRFDNKHFESNVATTMSTLDKLKQKLHLDGATKGLENVNAAAKKVDLSPLSASADAVATKFSHMQLTIQHQLDRIVDKAVDTGTRLVKSLSVDQIMAGWNKYGQKTASVQTIMNATGKSIDEVNSYLDKLMWFSDETSYGFTDMTAALGQMTSAGGDIDKLIPLITGVANATAFAGKGASEFSRVMYNLNQSYSKGYLDYSDWKSIDLAGVSSKQLKQMIIDVGVLQGKIKEGEVDLGSFATTLKDKWADTEVLEEAFGKFAEMSEKAYEMVQAGEVDTASEAYEILAQKYDGVAITAAKAAQEAKTFSEAIDATKDAVSSGWMKTFELIFGNYKESKVFWTDIANVLWDMFASGSEDRNAFLADALDSNWSKLLGNLKSAGIEAAKFEDNIQKVVGEDKLSDLIEEYGSLEEAVKNGAVSSEDLKKALDGIVSPDVSKFVDGLKEIDRLLRRGNTGEDVKKLQTALKELGYELGTFGQNGDGIDGVIGSVTEKAIKAFQEANGLVVDGIAGPETLAALEKAAEGLGQINGDVDELMAECHSLIDVVTNPAGRDLIFDSILNLLEAIQRPLGAVSEAFRNTFSFTPTDLYNGLQKINKFTKSLINGGILDADTWDGLIDKIGAAGIESNDFSKALKEALKENEVDVDDLIKQYGSLGKAFEEGAISTEIIRDVLLSFDGISETLVDSGETIDKIRRSFEGLFAAIDIVATVLSGPFKFVFKTVSKILENFGLGILDLTANVGDSLVKFRDNIDGVIETISTFIADHVTVWIDKFRETEFFKTVAGWFTESSDKITGAIDGITGRMKTFNGTTFGKGLTTVFDFLSGIADKVKSSKVFGFIVDTVGGALSRLKDFFTSFKLPEFNLDTLKNFFTNIVTVGDNMKLSGKTGLASVFSGIWTTLKTKFVTPKWTKIQTNLENFFMKFMEFWIKVGDIAKQAFEVCKDIGKKILEFLFGTEKINLPIIMDAVTKFLWIVTLIKTIGLIDSFVSPLDNVTSALNNFAKSVKWNAIASAFKAMALALAALTVCIVVIASLPDMNKAWQAAGMLAGLLVVMGLVIMGLGWLSGKMGDLDIAGVFAIAASLLLLVGAIALMVHTLKEMDSFKLKNPARTFSMLGAILLALTVGIKMIGSAANSNFKSVAAILTLLGALKLMLEVIESYDQFDWVGKGRAIEKMVEMMLLLAVSIRIMAGGLKGDSNFKGVALTIIAMVLALKLMIGAIEDIAEIPVDKLKKGIFVISVLMGIMSIFVAVANLTSKAWVVEKGQKGLNSFNGFAFALLAVVAAIWLLGKMPDDILMKGAKAVTQVLLVMTGMFAVIGKTCSGLQTGPIIAMLIAFVVLLAEMAIIIKCLDGVSWQSKVSTVVALGAMLLAMAGTMAILGKTDMNAKAIYKWLGALAVLTGLIAILGFVITSMQNVPWQNALGSAAALSILILAMAGVLEIVTKHRNRPETIQRWIGALAGLAAITIALGVLLKYMGDLDPLTSIGNAVALGILLGVMAGVIGILSTFKVTKDITGAIIAIGALGLVVLELGYFLSLINTWNISGMGDEVVVLSALLIVLTGVMAACVALGSLAMASWPGLIATVAAIAVLGAVVLELGYFLSLINTWNISGMEDEVMVLSSLLVVLTGVMAACVALGLISSFSAGGMAGCILGIGLLGLVVLELGLVLSKLKNSGIGGMMSDVLVLSALLVVLTGVMAACVALGLISSFSAGGMAGCILGIGMLGLVIYELGLVLAELKKADMSGMEKEAMVLSALLVVLTGVMAVCTLLGFAAGAAIAGIAVLIVFIGSLVELVTAIGRLMSDPELAKFLDTGIATLEKFAYGIGSIISNFGEGLTSKLPKIGENLSGFANNLGTFIDTMKSIDDGVAEKAKILMEAISTLTKSDFVDSINNIFKKDDEESSLEELGTELSGFATKAGDFIKAMSGMKPETATSIESFCGAIESLNTICGDNNFGDGALTSLGSSMEDFAGSMKGVSESLSDLTDDDVANIKRAADAGGYLAELNKSIPREGGDWQTIAGSQDLASWGLKIEAFADSLINFSTKVSGQNIDKDAITAASEAAQSVSDLNAGIPKTGGVWQDIAGEQDLQSWGKKIVAFADSLVAYSGKVSGQNIDKEAILRSADAATAIATLNDAIPESDGFWQWLTGEKDLSNFGTGLTSLADGIVNYANAAVQIDETKIEAIKNTGTAVEEIKAVVEKIPKTGGTASWDGDHDPLSFGQGIAELAKGIRHYCTMAATITQEDIDAITFTKNAVAAISDVVKNIPEIDNMNTTVPLSTAASNLKGFCDDVNAISTTGYDFSGISTIKTAITDLKGVITGVEPKTLKTDMASLKEAAGSAKGVATTLTELNDNSYGGVDVLNKALKDLASADVDGVLATFGDKAGSMQAAVSSLVDAIVNSLGGETAISNVTSSMITLVDSAIGAVEDKSGEFETLGSNSATSMVTGIESKNDDMTTAGETSAGKAVSGARTKYDAMRSAGRHLVNGFAAGITVRTWYAEAAAKTMADAAEQAARAALGINSPSRVFKEIGSGIPEGFSMGIGMLGGSVKSAVLNMADNALSTTSRAIASISSLVESGIDAQPTIRPVLDLSDVEAGTSTLSGMLNMGSTVGVNANLGAITSMMNRRGQNGTNADVVAELSKLRKDIGNMSNTTYQVNGVTYDDGSNITDAVRTLVRAARIERRV